MGDEVCVFFRPKENVLPPALKPRWLDPGIAGKGMLRISFGCGLCRSSRGVSVEEGRVELELYRADKDELSWPLEAELFVPPLPLSRVSV